MQPSPILPTYAGKILTFEYIDLSQGLFFRFLAAITRLRLTIHDNDPHEWQRLLPVGYSAMQTPSVNFPNNTEPDFVYNSLEILDVDDVNEAEMVRL